MLKLPTSGQSLMDTIVTDILSDSIVQFEPLLRPSGHVDFGKYKDRGFDISFGNDNALRNW